MALPKLRKILKEDVKEAPKWIDKILEPVNSFMESVYGILNKNVTFTDNIACHLHTLEVSTFPEYETDKPNTFNPYRYNTTLRTRPRGLVLLAINEQSSNYSPIVSAIHINWYSDGNTIHIPFISGLKPSTDYTLTLLSI